MYIAVKKSNLKDLKFYDGYNVTTLEKAITYIGKFIFKELEINKELHIVKKYASSYSVYCIGSLPFIYNKLKELRDQELLKGEYVNYALEIMGKWIREIWYK